MTAHLKNVETPLAFAVRIGLTWNRANSSGLLDWDGVVTLAVASYWRVRCGLPERRARRTT